MGSAAWPATQEPALPARTPSSRIFCTMKVATVLDSSLPVSMVRRQSGMISVDSRKLITSVSSTWGGGGPSQQELGTPSVGGRVAVRQSMQQ